MLELAKKSYRLGANVTYQCMIVVCRLRLGESYSPNFSQSQGSMSIPMSQDRGELSTQCIRHFWFYENQVVFYSCKSASPSVTYFCLSFSHAFKAGCLLLAKGVFNQDNSSQDKPFQSILAMGEVDKSFVVSGDERSCHSWLLVLLPDIEREEPLHQCWNSKIKSKPLLEASRCPNSHGHTGYWISTIL